MSNIRERRGKTNLGTRTSRKEGKKNRLHDENLVQKSVSVTNLTKQDRFYMTNSY